MAGRSSHPWFYAAKNTWYIWHDGKKVSLHVRGEENKAEAVKAWHRLFAGLPLQSPEMPLPSPIVPQAVPMVRADGVSVGEMIDAFLADCEGRVKPVTYEHYEKFCRFFEEDYGTTKADEITTAKAEAWARKPAWSSSTRHDALGVLATAFAWAKRTGLIANNPLVGIRKPPKASRGAKALISAEEHSRLVAHAEKQFGAFL